MYKADYSADEQQIIHEALTLLDKRCRTPGEQMTSPQQVKDYLRLHLESRLRECFMVLFLDNRHCLLAAEVLFCGAINSVTVHPREIVICALRCNAAAVICAHNHPSGCSEHSEQDRQMTERIREALALVEVRLLDHIVVGHGEVTSLSESGLL
ncbi:MAG: RadC family protein [Enterobacteriaceae bacterium]